MVIKYNSVAFLLLASSAAMLVGCEGDARPLQEQVEAADLNLQSITVLPPANSLSPLFIGTEQGIQLSIRGTTFSGNNTGISGANRRWTSSNASVVSVNENGFAIGKAEGQAVVSVSVAGAVAEPALAITVSDRPLQRIARIVSSADLIGSVSENLDPCLPVRFTAIGNYGGMDERALTDVIWSIDGASETADAQLFLTDALSPGATWLVGRTPTDGADVGPIELTASVGADADAGTDAMSESRSLTVTSSLNSLDVTPQDVSILNGRTVRIAAPVEYTGNTIEFATNGVRWSVDAVTGVDGVTQVPSVSVGTVGASPGVVTGLNSGTAMVRASCGAFTAASTVTVTGDAGNLVFERSADIILTLDEPLFTELSVSQGDTYDINFDVTNQAVWASSNTDVVTVDTDGDDRGDISAVGLGTAEVTAEFEGARVAITVEVR